MRGTHVHPIFLRISTITNMQLSDNFLYIGKFDLNLNHDKMSIVRNDCDKNTKLITSESNNFICYFKKKNCKIGQNLTCLILYLDWEMKFILLWSLFKKLSRSKV